MGCCHHALAANFSGTDSFTYKMNDGKAEFNACTVILTLEHVSHSPSAGAALETGMEHTASLETGQQYGDLQGNQHRLGVGHQPNFRIDPGHGQRVRRLDPGDRH